jgi:anthranilate phosphoribosyltransferase
VVVSPFASIVAAAAGAPQVMSGAPDMPPKHGTGVHEVLAALGVPMDLRPPAVERAIGESGFGYINMEVFAPDLHALKRRREELTLRSAFNTVEKMVNLASAPHHLIGLTHTPYMHRITGAMARLGFGRSFIVQGIEGNEDVQTWRPSRLTIVDGDSVEETTLDPGEYDLARVEREDLRADDPLTESIERFQPVLEGRGTAEMRDLVAYNAALRIWLGGRAKGMAEGLVAARAAIDSGAAGALLGRLRRQTASIAAK